MHRIGAAAAIGSLLEHRSVSLTSMTVADQDGRPVSAQKIARGIGLAMAANAILVSGDDHLLSLSGDLPIHPPARFLELLSPSFPG